MKTLQNIIPEDHPIFQQLAKIANSTQIVIFSGLPGVGKSLYINEFQIIAERIGLKVDIIQWDVARKAFETEYIAEHFPIGDGTVHNGVKLIAGAWLMDEVALWSKKYLDTDRILLIEAPLVGHRFIELIKPAENKELESLLSSDKTKVVMPIPSKRVRVKIEEERARQVAEDAKVWSGAKPSVMLMLWKMTCGIANEFGMDVIMDEQPPYNPDIYEFVFREILKHRQFEPLFVDEVFDVPAQDESALHNANSIKADAVTADKYGKVILDNYAENLIDEIVARWYKS